MLTEPEPLTVTVSVQDRGPAFGGERFVAELEGFALVRGSGGVGVGGDPRAGLFAPCAVGAAVV